ncbi:MAG: MFS transporter [Candidatus Lokiarchaeota archaeon]|nr:MFS transporter [Candidatus Lokiarchaeota archaeon]
MESTATGKTFGHYIFFWMGQLFSLLGSSVVQFVIVWWITIETKNPTIISVAFFFSFIPQFIFGPIAGVFTDRWNRKLIIGLSDFFQALTTFSLVLLFLFDIQQVWIVIMVNSFRGLFQAVHWPAVNAIIPLMIPKKHLSRMNGINYFFTGLINTLGPVIAGTLLLLFPINQILWIDIITFLIAITPLILIKIPSLPKKPITKQRQSYLREFKIGFKIIRMVPGLLSLLLVATILNFLGTPFSTLMVYFVDVTHSGTVQNVSFVLASIQAGMFLGAIIVIVKGNWVKKALIIFMGIIIGELGHFILALAPYQMFFIIALGGFIFAFIVPFVNTMFLTILQTVIPPDKQGRVMSNVLTIVTLVSPIGMVMSGPIAELISIRILFITSSLLNITFLVIVWIFSNIRNTDYSKVYDFDESDGK